MPSITGTVAASRPTTSTTVTGTHSGWHNPVDVLFSMIGDRLRRALATVTCPRGQQLDTHWQDHATRSHHDVKRTWKSRLAQARALPVTHFEWDVSSYCGT
eukprot:792544-Rhodomonas_salina.6